MIRLENVSKTFHTKRGSVHAVQGVNLHVKKGEIHGVIGYSGAGKSTLIRCINLLERPTSGKVWIGDDELTALSPKALQEKRKKIGMIFQGFNLLKTATVYDNIAIPLKLTGIPKRDIHERVEKYIDIVGLQDRKNAYPAQLSGGQKQRVAIARALALEPDLLLSDEATSALDPETTESILNLLLKINEELGITILLITHEMEVIQKICDSVSVMEDGQIIEQDQVLQLFIHAKHPTTRKFLQTMDAERFDPTFFEQFPKRGFILHLTFTKGTTNKPLISSLTRKYDVEPNIIHADIIRLKNGTIGSLLIHLETSERTLQDLKQYLIQEGIFVQNIPFPKEEKS